MKRALIIGGSGGLSGTLADMAKKQYEEVWVLTRGQKNIGKDIKHLLADRNDELAFQKAILESGIYWDVIFDCICMNEKHAKQDLEILGQRCKRLIVVSTDSVYASEYKKVLQNEEGIFVGDRPSCIEIPAYAIDKRRMEIVFQKYFKTHEKKQGIQVSIFRPGHLFGPGFLFGCFPMQSRNKDLLDIMKHRKINLVGMGTYLIHPVFAADLARVMLDSVENTKTFQEIFCIGGPEIIENKMYYKILGEILGVEAVIEEIPLTGFLEKYPKYYGHLCHRAYNLTKLERTGIKLPSTTLKEGLEMQYQNMILR